MSSRCTMLALVVSLAIPGVMSARITRAWTYAELFKQADLVVVATAAATKDTDQRAMLDDLTPAVRVIGVSTEFRICVVLKGPEDLKTFNLHHYRFESEDAELSVDAPALLGIPTQNQAFLLFLSKEREGTYVPVGGQTDPAMLSVLKLEGSAF